MKLFEKGNRSVGPLFTKGVRTSEAHLFSKYAPAPTPVARAPGGGQNAEHARHYLERPRR
jgi:hypothetical protein